jgi:hypothetical protein
MIGTIQRQASGPDGEGPHPGLLDTLARGLDPEPSLTDTEP